MSDTDPGLIWDDDGVPRSSRFGDVYFSKDGGLAETEAVFLQGCGLPQAWAGRRRFTVAELGFGAGLNMAALLTLWRRSRPEGSHLSLFSVEAFPVGAADARRALSRWPALTEAAQALTGAWPGRARGFHRVELPDFNATLDLAVMDAAEALEAWTGHADAWFLDGFAPARNPQMWSERVLAAVAARSAPGARAATYTVAGAVRRGLAANGFTVERKPGFGAKRERLEARLPGAAAEPPRPRVAIVGAGIAGASLVRAFRALGAEAEVFDPSGPGGGASGNPAALVMPRLDAGLGPIAALHAQAMARAAGLYDAEPDVVLTRAVLQLEAAERDARRFEILANCDLFEAGSLRRLSAAQTTALLGEVAPAGLLMEGARVIEPAPLLGAWADEVRPERIAGLDRSGGVWRLVDPRGRVAAEAEIVCLAAGLASRAFAQDLALSAVRGQAEFVTGAALPTAAVFGGYVAPTRQGVLFGATHDRGDEAADIRAADTARNRATLRGALPHLAERLEGLPGGARAAVRAGTPDYLPIAGALEAEGLMALCGLGSRGFCLAPLLAEHVAALALGAPSPLPRPLQALVAPERFRLRASRRRAGKRLAGEPPPV